MPIPAGYRRKLSTRTYLQLFYSKHLVVAAHAALYSGRQCRQCYSWLLHNNGGPHPADLRSRHALRCGRICLAVAQRRWRRVTLCEQQH